jgi:parallel beta-helix repeat protein
MGKLKWHIILVLALWLAFCGAASATQLYVNEGGWWCDGCAFDPSSRPIQSAVDAADNGDSIFVYNGSYTDNVYVTKRLTLIGEGADVVTVTSRSYSWEFSVFDVRADWVTISGFAVTGATNDGGVGIYIRYADHCNISGNYASGNYYGIRLYYSSNNTLSDNTANLNNLDGIVLHSSNGNTLMNNTANSNCDDGIVLDSSSDCTLTSNTANSNNGDGIYLDSSSNNIITCNWVQDNTERGVYLYESSTNNNISYNNIIKNGVLQGDDSYHWQFYNYQSNPVEAKHNYWGAGMNSNTIDASIYDDEEGGWGAVEFYPFETEPVPCAPTPEEPHTFTAADAVIALEIAVGSRSLDLSYDVSGDDSVTSLDALMILQAAAGAISL